jgi:hypothetical protein
MVSARTDKRHHHYLSLNPTPVTQTLRPGYELLSQDGLFMLFVITAVPYTKLCAWGEEDSGGHVL